MGLESIFRYSDALRLPRVDDSHRNDSLPSCVSVEAPGRTRKFRRAAPEFLDDPENIGIFTGLAEDVITYPPSFIACARNAFQLGYRTVLTEEGQFFNDDSHRTARERLQYLADFGSFESSNEETGLRRLGAANRFTLDIGERTVQSLDGTAVLLGSVEPSNYGSWLFRVLPKLHSLSRMKWRQPTSYLVWDEIPVFKEYLALLGVAEDEVVHLQPHSLIYHADRIVVPSIRNNQAFLDPESVEFFAGLRRRFGVKRQSGSRMYVSRALHARNGSARVMLNEDELIDRLIGLDFRIVSPETLSVADQIEAFSSAEMVVGPSGSGMFNVVFCHPGTKIVDIESEPHWIHAHCGLFASCGLEYGIFVGNARDHSFQEHHQPWTVHIESLIARIATFSSK